MTRQTESDKRRFRRIRVNLAVVYRIARPTAVRMVVGNEEFRATMLDLSEGGISVLASRNIPQGAVLSIKFTLFKVDEEDVSFYGPMEIAGEVRYSAQLGVDEYRLGIYFKRITKQDQAEIAAFISAVAKD